MPNLLFLDYETTGTDPFSHSIHRMAGEVVIDRKVACSFDYKMKPDPLKRIDTAALAIAGVTTKEILAYPKPYDVFQRFVAEVINPFVDWQVPMSKLFVVAYNAGGLEMPFLREWYTSLRIGRQEFASHFHSGFIDVMSHATQYFINNQIQVASYSLSSVASLMGIPVDKSRLHNPVYDVELTRKIYELIVCE